MRGLYTAGRLLLVAVALILLADTACRLSASERETIRRWLIYGAVVGVVITLALIAIIGSYTVWVQQPQMPDLKLTSLSRAGSIISILIWLTALSITQNHGRGFAVVFIVLAVTAVYLLPPTTPLLATFIGASAFVVAWYARSLAMLILVAAFVLFIFVVPFLDTLVPLAIEFLVANHPSSFRNLGSEHRFVIWQFVAEQILERPLFGWRIESARLFPGRETEMFLFNGTDGTVRTGPALPLHTHNAMIQIWLELSLVGVALFAALFISTVRAIPHVPGNCAKTAVSTAAIATGFINAQFSFGIWQGWWLTLGIAAVLTAAVVGRPPELSENLEANESQ